MKPVAVSFRNVNGNAYSLLGTWKQAAQSQGLAPEEIDQVIEQATSGDHHHLLQTLLRHSVEPADQGGDHA